MGSLRVVIVGAVIGGLSTALALRRAGAQVQVFEQAPELGEVGAGLDLFPNSAGILQRWGIFEEVTRRAVVVPDFWFLRHDGSVASHQISGKDGSITSLAMYRPDLISVLAARLTDEELYTGHRCEGFSQLSRSSPATWPARITRGG